MRLSCVKVHCLWLHPVALIWLARIHLSQFNTTNQSQGEFLRSVNHLRAYAAPLPHTVHAGQKYNITPSEVKYLFYRNHLNIDWLCTVSPVFRLQPVSLGGSVQPQSHIQSCSLGVNHRQAEHRSANSCPLIGQLISTANWTSNSDSQTCLKIQEGISVHQQLWKLYNMLFISIFVVSLNQSNKQNHKSLNLCPS